jgi:large subunit ribosomal protein L4
MTTQVQEKSKSFSHAVTAKELGIAVPKKPVSKTLFAIWVRTLLQNWRQGTVGVKGRSDVSFSNKKPWKQKGTGRARAGSARSPLWRGGGVIFGPQPRVRKLTLPQKMKKQILTQLVVDRIKNKQLIVADWGIDGDKASTKQAALFLKNAGLANKKITLMLPSEDMLTFASFVNIPHVQILLFDQVNAYDLANSEIWLVLQKDFDSFKTMVGGWQ